MPEVASEAQASSPSLLQAKQTRRASQGAGREANSPFSSFFDHASPVAQRRNEPNRTDNVRNSKAADSSRNTPPARQAASKKDASPAPAAKNSPPAASSQTAAPSPDRADGYKTGDASNPDAVDGSKTGDVLDVSGVDGVKTGDAKPAIGEIKSDDNSDRLVTLDVGAQGIADALAAEPDTAAIALAAAAPAGPLAADTVITAKSSNDAASAIGSDQAKLQIPVAAKGNGIASHADSGAELGQPAEGGGETGQTGQASSKQPGDKLASTKPANAGEPLPDATGIKPAADSDNAEHAGKGHAAVQAHQAAQAGKPGNPAAEPNPPAQPGNESGAAAPVTQAPSAHAAALTVAAPHSQAAQALANAGPAAHAKNDQSQPVPIEGLGVEISVRAKSGNNQFEIRLDPPELGRIEVRLHVDDKGQVTSRLIADRLDTLDLLRRDASGLERALQDAGLKTSSNGMQFSLRDHGAGQHGQPDQSRDSAQIIVKDDSLAVTETPQRHYRGLAGLRGGLDIRV